MVYTAAANVLGIRDVDRIATELQTIETSIGRIRAELARPCTLEMSDTHIDTARDHLQLLADDLAGARHCLGMALEEISDDDDYDPFAEHGIGMFEAMGRR
jgi:septation ring formation regulator EzrA